VATKTSVRPSPSHSGMRVRFLGRHIDRSSKRDVSGIVASFRRGLDKLEFRECLPPPHEICTAEFEYFLPIRCAHETPASCNPFASFEIPRIVASRTGQISLRDFFDGSGCHLASDADANSVFRSSGACAPGIRRPVRRSRNSESVYPRHPSLNPSYTKPFVTGLGTQSPQTLSTWQFQARMQSASRRGEGEVFQCDEIRMGPGNF
jgi:hypothetical protein